MRKVIPLPFCTEEQTLELMIECEHTGNYSVAARAYQKIINSHESLKGVPNLQWTLGNCINRLSDYYRKHFAIHNNYNR